MRNATDYDGAWKEALDIYLRPVLELCFPEVARRIDWSAPPESLDKEFQEIVRDADIGKQRVDKLVKVRSLDGAEEWVLVHVEVQSQPDQDLPRRIYQHHHRIVDRHGIRTVTLAVLADRRPGWRPQFYEEELWGCRVKFDYPVCKFLDFDRGGLEASGNPAAIVVAAHMEAQETPGAMATRKHSRLRLCRRLYSAGYSRKDRRELLRLINWLMVLPVGMEQAVAQELNRIEKENTVEFIPFMERASRAEGIAEGEKRGRQKGAAEMAVLQARKRFPKFRAKDAAAVRALPLSGVEAFGEALLDFPSIDELRRWLAERPHKG